MSDFILRLPIDNAEVSVDEQLLQNLKEQIAKESSLYRRRYKGFVYWIIRPFFVQNAFAKLEHDSFHLCGYVEISRDSDYFVSESFYDYEIDCHGGLTFADSIKNIGVDFAIGFDCCHSCDISILSHLNYAQSKYRDVDFVDKQCKLIIDQLLSK